MVKDTVPGSRRPPNANGGIGLVFAGLLAGMVVTAFSIVFIVESLSWDWQRLTGSEAPNLIEAWRNIGLIALGAVGLGVATWRSIIAHRQNQNAVEQRRISERGLNVDRYQKGALMLESPELSVRIAGIYGLRELAMSDPDESYILVQSLLFAFVREKSKSRALKQPVSSEIAENADGTDSIFEEPAADLNEALRVAQALRTMVPAAGQLEDTVAWLPDLTDANLSGPEIYITNLSNASLGESNLSGVVLINSRLSGSFCLGTNFSSAQFVRADFSGSFLYKADLSSVNIVYADIRDANLSYANISGANIEDVGTNVHTEFFRIWAWADRPPRNMPPEIEAAIIYLDPTERKDGD
jgi:hypothetical protein